VQKNASIDIDWYIQQAKRAEAAKFDTSDYESNTLRGNLGLPFPKNRHVL
jgi:hypothetical protein